MVNVAERSGAALSVAELHDEFIATTIEFPEHRGAVHERWTRIISAFPETRSKRLYEGFDETYRAALTSDNLCEITAAISLVQLQIRFWGTLRDTKRVFDHVFQFENTALFVWQMKLINRFESIEPAKRAKKKIIPSKKGETAPLLWLN